MDLQYYIEVDARTGEVIRFVEVLLRKDKDTRAKKDEQKDITLTKEGAIEKFQKAMKDANNEKLDNKDDFLKDKDRYKEMKKEAIKEFKEAKDKIKAAKKEQKQKLKEEKKSNKMDEKPINEIKYLSRKQIEEIALKKFKNKNIKSEDIEVELKKDNPPIYIVVTYDKVNKTEYELVIHATTGMILEYERALD